MHWKRTLFTIGATIIGLGVLASYWYVDVRKPEDADVMVIDEPGPIDAPFVTFVDPSRGHRDAKITVVEFGDHACSHCRSTQEAVDRLLVEHPTDVRFVWKSAPSPLHAGSDTAAEAALCAGRQGKFWEYHAVLFENASHFDETTMAILANELELDSAEFNACVTQDLTRPLVERTVTEARALGMTGIPTTYVNGVRYEGAMTYEQLLEATGL